MSSVESLAINAPAGLGRVVCAAPDVATALGYDIAAALEEPDGPDGSSAGSRRPVDGTPEAEMNGPGGRPAGDEASGSAWRSRR